ncbi:pyridoxamine 5'-phosphate oxidase family protein [Luteimonas sp. RIT-PG2_3]
MRQDIDSTAALETCIGTLPGPRDLKVIDHLDAHAIAWLAACPLLFAAFGDDSGIAISPAGGPEGFAHAIDAHHLSLPLALLDAPEQVRAGQGFGSLMMVPGMGETLRVNGRVLTVDGGEVRVAVEECYLHCAKAVIRSDFWTSPAGIDAPPDASADAPGDAAQDETQGDTRSFIDDARFMLLATMDHEGRTDLSPKGDPTGALLRMHDGAIWFPDRPGNRRVDSFRNILAQSRIAILALVPGRHQALHVTGSARLDADEDMRSLFRVQDKTPRLATCVEPSSLCLQPSAALARARPWPARPRPPHTLEPAEIFKAHVKLSRSRGLQAALVRTTISIPGLMQKGLDSDYKKNLY